MVWLRGKSATRSRRMRASARGGPQRLSTSHAFSRRLRSQVKGSPLDVPPRQRGRSSRRCLAFPAIRRCGRRPAGSRLPHPGGRASGMGAQWRGASDLPHRRVRPPARLAHPAGRRPVSAPGADVPARPAGDARPCDPCGRGGSRQDDRGGAPPEGVHDPGPRPPGPDPHARVVDGAVAGGDGIEVRAAVCGPPIRRRLGTSGALHTYDRVVERYVGSADGRVPAHVPELRDRLRDVMVRNRRGIAFTLPPRRVHSLPVRLSPRERRLYDDVTEFVRDAYWSVSGRMSWAARLTLIVLQREIGSSTFAVAETLNRLTQSPLFGAAERERLEALRDDARAIPSNVKADHLAGFLRSSDEKALVFTQYLRTMHYLKGVLEGDGHRVVIYHGGLPPAAKDAAVRSFRGEGQIFLSTEAGGEGRNLQFARTVVNYDLPWNPLRIEQRIGRVHRLGQTREVHVVNLWAQDTVEADLMELLDRKIHMFELVVGELDLILGTLDERRSFEDMMMEIWTLRQAEERRAALRRLGDALVRARDQYDAMRERNDEALRDVSDEVRA